MSDAIRLLKEVIAALEPMEASARRDSENAPDFAGDMRLSGRASGIGDSIYILRMALEAAEKGAHVTATPSGLGDGAGWVKTVYVVTRDVDHEGGDVLSVHESEESANSAALAAGGKRRRQGCVSVNVEAFDLITTSPPAAGG